MYDAWRFLLSKRTIAEKAPLQLYSSALVFCPEDSLIRTRYYNESSTTEKIYPTQETKWDSCIQILEGHTDIIISLAFLNTHVLASGPADKTVRVWDLATGSLRLTLEGHTESVRVVAFSPNGSLASGSYDATVRIRDPTFGTLLKTFDGHSDGIFGLAFSSVGLLASASRDGTIHMWDPTGEAAAWTLEPRCKDVMSLAFSPDGKLASFSEGGTVRLWNSATGTLLHSFEGHPVGEGQVAFPPNDSLIVGAGNGAVFLWELAIESIIAILRPRPGGYGNSMAFSATGTLAFGKRAAVSTWSRVEESYSELRESVSTKDRLEDLIESHHLRSYASDRLLKLDDIYSTDHVEFEGSYRDVSAVGLSLNGELLASASDDCSIRLCDISGEASTRVRREHSLSIEVIALSNHSKQLASASNTIIQLWDATTGICIRTFIGHTKKIQALAFSADDELLASGSFGATMRLWNVETGHSKGTIEVQCFPICTLKFSMDSTLLASTSLEGEVRLWNTSTCQLHSEVQCDGGFVALEISPNKSQLAMGDNSLWGFGT